VVAEQRPRWALIAFTVYFVITLSKKFWLPLLDGVNFWMADAACFVLLPALLVAVFRLPLVPAFRIGERSNARLDTGLLVYLTLLNVLGLFLLSQIGWGIGAKLVRHFPEALPRVIDYYGHAPKAGICFVLAIAYFAVTAGVVEEYVFRGLLSTVCGHYFPRSVSVFVIVSTLSFAWIHWGGGLANVVLAGLTGVLLALIHVRTGDLRLPMLAHTLIGLRWLF